jgi:hypothetical protein
MANMIPFIFAGLLAGLPPAVFAQEPSPSMRVEAQGIDLQEVVSVNPGSARQVITEILRSAQRAGGMVTLSGCGEPDQGTFRAAGRSSVASALDLLTATYPEYYWSIQDGAVDLLPRRNRPKAMDIRIQHIDWDTTASVNLSIDTVFHVGGVGGLLAKLGIAAGLEEGPGLQRPPRVVNGVPEPPPQGRKYELENVSVLTALNAVVASYGSAIWWYDERTCDGKTTYRLFTQDLRRPK